MRPHRWQPIRLPRPWDSPGKNTGVGGHFLLQCLTVKSESEVAQSCPTRSDPTDCSPPSMGFSRQEYWSGVPLPSVCRSAIPELVRRDSDTHVSSLTPIMNDGAPRPCHIWTEESFYISRAVFFHLCSSPTKKNILKGKREAPPAPDTPALVRASSCPRP